MSNQPARFRQSELVRAIKAAKVTGARLAVVEGTIIIDPQPANSSISPTIPQITDGKKPVAGKKEIVL